MRARKVTICRQFLLRFCENVTEIKLFYKREGKNASTH